MTVTEYTWDPVTDSILEETDGIGNVLASYTNEPSVYGPLIGQHNDGETRYFHFDVLGSTRELTDNTEAVTDTFTYDAWGNEVQRSGANETAVRWVGRVGYRREGAVDRFDIRARQYCSSFARWLSVDPLDSRGVVDKYSYGGLNPVNQVDPTGKIPMCNANFCSLAGPFGNYEGIYGIRTEIRATPGTCCDGSTVHFHWRESHEVPPWASRLAGASGCGEPANDEISRGVIWPFRFGDILQRNCSAPRQTRKQSGKNRCWVIDIEWECNINCTGACNTNESCSPTSFLLGIYPRRWSDRNLFAIRVETSASYNAPCCILNSCDVSTGFSWRNYAGGDIPTAGGCQKRDVDFLWTR